MFQTTNQKVLDSRTPAVDVLGASGLASKRRGALPGTSDGPGDVRRHHVELKLENTWNCLSWELQCIRTGKNPFVVKLRMAFHWIDHIVHYNTNTCVYIYIYIHAGQAAAVSTLRCSQVYTDESDVSLLYLSAAPKLKLKQGRSAHNSAAVDYVEKTSKGVGRVLGLKSTAFVPSMW